jgi:hypothetical protein
MRKRRLTFEGKLLGDCHTLGHYHIETLAGIVDYIRLADVSTNNWVGKFAAKGARARLASAKGKPKSPLLIEIDD